METGTFKSFDNADIFYRVWNYNPSQKTIVILHRGHEHSGRLQAFAEDEQFVHFNIFGFDMRGLGHTSQPVSPHFMDYVRDLDAFVKYLHEQYGIVERDIFVVANSIAGVIVSAWCHDFAPRIAGMALLAPAFTIKLYVPFAKTGIALAARLFKHLTVPSYVKSKVLTHDVEQQKAYDTDPLITREIDAHYLLDLLKAGKRIVEDAAAITIPTLLLSAGKDYVVKDDMQKRFFVDISSTQKRFIKLKGFYHGLLFETQREQVYNPIAEFINRCFSLEQPPTTCMPDKFTVDEYNKMALNMLPRIERWGFRMQKWMLHHLGFLSKGMRVGLKYGFDSGMSLDYVYRNQAQGCGPIGRWIDKGYLNAIGWRGVRIRREHLIATVEERIETLKQRNEPVKILDIAGGTGNYLFDIKRKFPEIEVVINDFSEANIAFGEAQIQQQGLQNIRFTRLDCFNKDSYRQLNFEPNIVIISGIFELFGDNELVCKAISGALSALQPGGFLVYTGQPWHPQLKMIAFVLNSHQERDWIMRRRSQRELDSLFAFYGLTKCGMKLDNFGIFTVSYGMK